MSYRRRFFIAALIAACGFFLSARTGSSHDPITTKVMFNKEVIRILQRNCLGCHAPNKIKSDIPLTTYEEARPWAKAIKEEVLEKRMMPFQAVKGYGRFQHDYVLPQRDIELLVSWIEGGAPRGEAKDYPKAEIEKLIKGDVWPLGQPDLILQPETKLEAEGDDEKSGSEIRCVVLPTGLKEPRRLNAMDFQPGNGTIVHTASFHRLSSLAKIAGKTSSCGVAGETLGVWVPGQSAVRMPEGLGHRLEAESSIVLKIHYRRTGKAVTDRSRLALYFAKAAAGKLVRNVTISPATTIVPANAEYHAVKASLTLNNTSEAVSIRPLLFPFAKSIEATAYRPNGSIEVLIVAKNYRYDWQPAYQFRKPIPLPKGTRIEVRAYFDNSENNHNNPNDPPAAVQFAEPLCELTLTLDNLSYSTPIGRKRKGTANKE
ncbi:MAG TPA: hypothetical protein PLD20_05945 [Blastocatellia bacterium]|nr:hypothetical protein [Blastocatellia bacterium]HMZ17449.1 hypothetical protein [Blastocatellia bacterium]HNG28767.1 hypothetical protein [Blastocatellia bacterium]